MDKAKFDVERDTLLNELQRVTEEEVAVQMELDRVRSEAKKAREVETILEQSWSEIEEDTKSPTDSVDEVLAMVDEALTEIQTCQKSSKDQVEQMMQSLYNGERKNCSSDNDDETDLSEEKEEEDPVARERLRRLLSGGDDDDDLLGRDNKKDISEENQKAGMMISQQESNESRLSWLREQLTRYKRLESDLESREWSIGEAWVPMADGQPWAYLALSTRVEEAYEWAAWSVWTKWSTKLEHLPKELKNLYANLTDKDEERFLTNENGTRLIPITTISDEEYISVEPWRPVGSWEYADSVDAFALGLGLVNTPGTRRALGWPLRTLRRRKWATELARHKVRGLGPLAAQVFRLHAHILQQEALCTKLSQEYQRVQAELDSIDEAASLAHVLQAELLVKTQELEEINKHIKQINLLLAASGCTNTRSNEDSLPSSPSSSLSPITTNSPITMIPPPASTPSPRQEEAKHNTPVVPLHLTSSTPVIRDNNAPPQRSGIDGGNNSKSSSSPHPVIVITTTRSRSSNQQQEMPMQKDVPPILASSVSF
uniref:Uncharacterized protein n=1 Tax=Aureoumbra lagunensis TaxID=44058 RepID=A0A7S3NJD4_9STRA